MIRIFLNPLSGTRRARTQHQDHQQAIHARFPDATIMCLNPGLDVSALANQDPANVPYIAAGGDGTIRAVAQALAGTARPFGVLPLGTHNHFARDLGLPLDLAAAAAVIHAGHTRPIDAASVNHRIFVNNSSLGAYPAMVMDRERMRKSGRNHWASLVLASLRAFVRFRKATVEMSSGGRNHTCTTPFLFVGNNEYCLDGVHLGHREALDRGTLALYLAPGATRAGILRMAFAALLGRLRQTPEYQEFLVTEFSVHVRGRRRIRVSLDGEVQRIPGPLHYRILPAALNVLVPETPEAG